MHATGCANRGLKVTIQPPVFGNGKLVLQENGVLFAPANLRMAQLSGDAFDRATYFANLGHDTQISDTDMRSLDELFNAVSANVPLTPPDEREPLITRLNIGNTYHCNMGCTYCYNELDVKDRKGSEVVTGMSIETGRRAIDALIEQAPDGHPLSLVFIGGEALLELRTLRQIVSYAQQRCADTDHAMRIAVYTNGTLMTSRVIQWANEQDVSLVVSLDGPPKQNDTYRIFRAGRPTSKAVLRRIRVLMDESTQTLRRVRAVAVRSVDLVALHQYLFELGFNEIHVQPVYDETGIETGSAAAMEALLEWYLAKLSAGTILSVLPFENFFERFLTQGRAVTSWYPCTAGRTALGVGPDGRVYPCHHFLEESTFEVGHVNNGLPEISERRKFFQRVDEREPCSSCWARHACGGECYHRAHTAGAGYTGVLPAVCRDRKSHIGLALDGFARLAREYPDVLRDLAMKRYSPVQPRWDAYDVDDLAVYHGAS
jgi:uncharacterized protein